MAVVGNRAVGSLEAEFWKIREEVGYIVDFLTYEVLTKEVEKEEEFGGDGVTLEEEDIVRGGY